MVKVVSAKQKKMQLFDKLSIENLKKICRIEGIPSSGKKDEIVERVARKLRLKKARNFSRKLGISERFLIFKHTVVPKHRIITKKEKEQLLKKYGIKLRQLPRIGVRDSAAMVLDAEIGDVIEIKRESPTAGEIKYYRVVVDLKGKQ